MPGSSWLSRIRACGVLLAGFAIVPATESPAQELHKRVLILHSFGSDFGPYNEVASRFQTELARLWPGTVEFYEASLETARFAEISD
jgi:hypothetical protein